MSTLLQAVKQIVSFADETDLKDWGYKETSLYQIYMDEVGNYSGFNQKAITEYCRGLPSVVKFPFYNGDILIELAGFGIERKTPKGRDDLIDKYWDTLGYVVFQHLKKKV